MLLGIRLSFLFLITAPVLFFSTELMSDLYVSPIGSAFMNGSYEEQWKEVDKALDEGLPKTALELVEVIYTRAKREGNQSNTIKAISYRVALRAVTNEEDEVVLIRDLEKEIAGAEQPVRAILTSMLADVYWGYYQMNRWQINERSQVEDAPEDDFRTWDASTFFDTTATLYLQALEPAEMLKAASVTSYKDILHHEGIGGEYRPTMYDILAHRALAFFQNDETDLPRPQQDFEVTDLRAVVPLGHFLRMEFTSPNPDNPKYRALLLYQELLRFHAEDNNDEALLDLDLLRLDFGREITWNEEKDTTYFESVTSLYNAYSSTEMSAQAGYMLAKYMHGEGDYVDALKRCRTEIERFPQSRGAVNCRALEAQILSKELQLNVEQSQLPDAPFLISAGFRNVGRVHFRIVRMPADEISTPSRHYDNTRERMADYLSRERVSAWSQNLPVAKDYKSHRVDLRGPELPTGTYMLFMSHDENFALDDNAVAWVWLRVTRLSMLSGDDDDGDKLFWVTDAENGKPLKDVKVDVFTQRWNSGNYKYERVRQGSMRTDANGQFELKAGRHRDGVFFRLSLGGDTLAIGQSFYAWERGKSRTQRKTLFFTDRAIYRPGQTVHVKGIVLEGDHDEADFSVVKKTGTVVVFYDANHEKVHEAKLVTNKYGSFNTVFTVPSGVLTGLMSIRNEWGQTTIRVEEYKRPKFEVAFEPVEGTYRLNETVTATGGAKAYAGSNIDGAAVSWRVVRRTRYPYWFWWWRPYPRSEDREIAHGTTTTDGDGKFTVEFEALPDGSVDKSTQPVFTYEISADVVDINGETHSATTSVSAGYTSIELGAQIAALLDAGEKQHLVITARNLSGQPVTTDGTVTVERLDAPERIFRERYLPKPDMWLMDAAAFRRDFPHDIYKDENIPDTWNVAEVALQSAFNTDGEGQDSLQLNDLEPGRYRITVKATDPSGEELLIKRFVTAYEPGGDLPVPEAMFFVDTKTHVEPGETAKFLFGSGYDNVHMMYRVRHRDRMAREGWERGGGSQKEYSLKVTEKHRGGMTAQIFFVRHYRMYQQSVVISVPWSNKQLTLETATFRDKLQPGQKEEWRITIKGTERERVAAEVVASMYDASLDAIYQQSWPRFSWPFYAYYMNTAEYSFGAATAQMYIDDWNRHPSYYHQRYQQLNLFLLGQGGRFYGRRQYMAMKSRAGGDAETMYMSVSEDVAAPPSPAMEREEADGLGAGRRDKNEAVLDEAKSVDDGSGEEGGDGSLDMVKARTNFNETAFFYPDLMTDDEGNIVLKFTAPEALTRWKLRMFAHTPDLKTGYLEKTTVTQKELMVMPNMPRFLREGDHVVLMTKITNLSDTALSGRAMLKLFDALSMKPLDAEFDLRDAERNFSVEKGRSTTARWEINVPEGVSAIVYRIVAQAGSFSDGEEMALPVLPNRMLVTETLPLNVRGGQTRTYTFDKLVNSGGSSTLRHHQLTLEMTSQPAWYAVQALPYLMEYPYECSEQVFNRYYANSIASHIVNSNPKIKRVFDQWKNTDALLSNLQKNQDLKMLLLEETPWVMQGKDESERKKRIALLFDLNTMGNNLESAMRKLEQAQASNGGWPWFPGMPESRYITQYITAGFGHLAALGATPRDERAARMMRRAVEFMDERMYQDYMELKRRERTFDEDDDYLNYLAIQYLYARSYFLEQEISDRYDEAVGFWLKEARKWWARRGHMAQGMIALALHRFKEKDVPQAIVRSLKERSLQNDEMGMYWKYDRGWFWYQAPIETQALLIEVFDEVAGDMNAVEEMKIWLLKQKQVQDWGTTVATAEACYALLRRGSNLLASDKLVEVTMGGERIDPKAMGANIEAGTGHYRVDWRGSDIDPSMGNVTVKKEDQGIAWGAVYWQYFEQLDKITPAKTPLQIEKKLFLQRNTEKGVVLEPITEKNPLRVGDVLKVRITVRVDRDMEYVHMKDMRGAGLELVNQLSGHRWQGGLGYYEAPKDASVNFFFHWLRKGVHVFEYPLRVSHEGRFSNGISAIQCMYAPEFAAHTAGVTVTVK
ncbi:MAG: hypothetical protein C0600_06835 [Ignavibacteria bacterium]|nr:MAG: hypothetical protein C0600_06835 [Ignavibacteria bacterium]